jgi:hypothetical protein
MAKRINTDELNENLIIASVRDRKIMPENKPAEVSNSGQSSQAAQFEPPKPTEPEQPEQVKPEQVKQPEQVEQSEQVEQQKTEVIPATSEPQKTATELPKEDGRRKRKSQDYESMFIKESNITARLGKTVYIRKEYHDRILKIVQVIGANEVSLFSYIDNIIAHHFESFQDDISLSYKNKISTNIF